ncbi:MAG: hypothetical protein ACJ8AT_00210 [Hyalangium sp.]
MSFLRPPSPPCPPEELVEPISATSEAYGPQGGELPSEVVFSGPDASPVLGFSLEQPGHYHFATFFSPVGGVFQSDLHAARDRSDQPPLSRLPSYCPSLERTTQGAWVCYSKVFRGDTQEAFFYNTHTAVAGDTVWVVSDTEVRRFVDTGTQLTLTDSLSDPDLHAEFLLPSPDELLVVRVGGLVRYTRDQGLVRSVTPTPWNGTEVGFQAPPAILLRDGDRLMFVSRLKIGAIPPLAEEACPYRLTARGTERTQDACQTLPGQVVGFEPDVLWLAETGPSPTSQLLHRHVFKGGRLVEEGALNLDSAVEFVPQNLRLSNAVPVLRTPRLPGNSPDTLYAVVAWEPERQELLLDALNPGITLPRASRSFYWGLVSPGGPEESSRIYPRPP